MRHLRAVPDHALGLGTYESKNINWPTAITTYLETLRAGGSPETTIYTRRQHLEHAAKRIPAAPYEVSSDMLLSYFAAQTWQPETRRGRRATFRNFYAHAMERGHTFTNPAAALPAVKPAQPKPRPAPDSVLLQALAAAGPREQLMIRLAGELGLRRGEVAVIHSSDIVETAAGFSLIVHGKGAKDRTIPLPAGLAAVLRSKGQGFIFPGDDAGHLSPRYVGKLIASIMPEGWTMHALRHRFATRAYSLDNDLLTVQALLGHASPTTTRLYVQLPDAALRSTVERLAS